MVDCSNGKNWATTDCGTPAVAMCLVSILDILFVMLKFNHANYPYPWLAALIRPFFLIYNIRVIRDFWERYIEVMIDTIPMVLFLIVFILYFSWMG